MFSNGKWIRNKGESSKKNPLLDHKFDNPPRHQRPTPTKLMWCKYIYQPLQTLLPNQESRTLRWPLIFMCQVFIQRLWKIWETAVLEIWSRARGRASHARTFFSLNLRRSCFGGGFSGLQRASPDRVESFRPFLFGSELNDGTVVCWCPVMFLPLLRVGWVSVRRRLQNWTKKKQWRREVERQVRANLRRPLYKGTCRRRYGKRNRFDGIQRARRRRRDRDEIGNGLKQ